MGKAKRKTVVFAIPVKASEDQLKGYKGLPLNLRRAVRKTMLAASARAFEACLNNAQEYLYKMYAGAPDDNN